MDVNVTFNPLELRLIKTLVEDFTDPELVVDCMKITEEQANDLLDGLMAKLKR